MPTDAEYRQRLQELTTRQTSEFNENAPMLQKEKTFREIQQVQDEWRKQNANR